MNNLSSRLGIEILTPWHVGAGREGGAYADNLVNKDQHGLPVLNGKSLKGLLRAACVESKKYQWVDGIDQEHVDRLFGTEGTHLSSQGALEISSATLSDVEQAYFKRHPETIRYLYRIDYQTAINPETGAAQESSLRSIETVIPLKLRATIHLNNISEAEREMFWEWIQVSLPLIVSIGGKRRRGYGEAIFSLIAEDK